MLSGDYLEVYFTYDYDLIFKLILKINNKLPNGLLKRLENIMIQKIKHFQYVLQWMLINIQNYLNELLYFMGNKPSAIDIFFQNGGFFFE